MRKTFHLLTVLLLTLFIAPQEGKGQGVPPAHTELIMPSYTGSTLLDIHTPIHTSAYSYPQVLFDMTGTGSYTYQDLYVYSCNSGNYTSSIIAWIRRNPMSLSIVDTGYIYVPTTKTSLEVGIVQAPDMKVYVIASFMGANGAEYDLYEWTPTGLTILPVYSENIRWSSAIPSRGLRMTMDCYDLRRVVFAWDEDPRYDSGGIPVNFGGIFTRAMQLTSSTFPLFTSGESVQVDGTDSTYRMPDIAMGMNGTIARVAYFQEFPAFANIRVESAPFASIYGIITPGMSLGFTLDWSVPAGTTVTGNPYADHIRIDCPDQVTAASDVWAVVYKPDMASVKICKQGVSGTPTDVTVSGILAGNNCSPVVAYGPDTSYINIGWYNTDVNRYVSRRIQVSGPGYFIPGGFSYYIVSNTTMDAACGYGSRMAFCTQQSIPDLGAFIAYPIVDYFTLGGLGDMRSKVVSWSPSIGPFSAQGMLPEEEIRVLPNPFSSEIRIQIPGYRGEYIDAALYDITGRQVFEIKATDLDAANSELGKIAGQLTPGTYLLKVNHSGKQTHFKITRL